MSEGAASPLGPPDDNGRRKPALHPVVKGVILLALLSAALAVVYFTPLKQFLTEGRHISERLQSAGWAAPAIFVVSVALLVAVGCPRLLLCPIGGMAFGFAWGLLWAQVGTLIGSYATFVFVQWGGRDFAMRKWPKLERLSHRVTRKGILQVMLVRQLPVGGVYINIMLGLTPLRHRDFLIGTLLGIMPEAIPATLIGAGATQTSFYKSLPYIVIAVCVFMIVGLWVRRRMRSTAANPQEQPAEEPLEAPNDGREG